MHRSRIHTSFFPSLSLSLTALLLASACASVPRAEPVDRAGVERRVVELTDMQPGDVVTGSARYEACHGGSDHSFEVRRLATDGEGGPRWSVRLTRVEGRHRTPVASGVLVLDAAQVDDFARCFALAREHGGDERSTSERRYRLSWWRDGRRIGSERLVARGNVHSSAEGELRSLGDLALTVGALDRMVFPDRR